MPYTVKENAPVAPYCTMRVGGNAKYIVTPDDINGLVSAVRHFAAGNEKYIVVGNCSNLIFPDSGFDGAVIITSGVKCLDLKNGVVTAACGETLSALARFARDNSLKGLEFCYGIPGTVGGGMYMNAGAYGGELSQRVVECLVLDESLDEKTLSVEELDFGYRKSKIAEKGYILLSASFKGEQGDKAEITASMETLMSRRKASQPLEYPSCGSTFKRPEGNFAGALIEQCGLKGASVGGAEVSEKHAGFIINKQGATAKDVLELIELVRSTVFEKTGVMLEPEVKIIE